MKKEMTPPKNDPSYFILDSFNQSSEDFMGMDNDNIEEYGNTHSERPFSRDYVANIDYDNLSDDMIFPS